MTDWRLWMIYFVVLWLFGWMEPYTIGFGTVALCVSLSTISLREAMGREV
jgi:hypothetical protein